MRFHSPSRAAFALALAVSCAGALSVARADTELDVANGVTDLTTLSATSDSDLTFPDITYDAPAFTITAAAVTAATLNDLTTTQTLILSNAGPDTPSTLTLSGGSNAVSPVAADLLYVAPGGTFTINGGATTATPTNTLLGLTLSAPGNLDVEGTANIGAATAWGASAITKTGAGVLALTSSIANTSTGAFTIADGTLSIGGGGNAGNTALGVAGTLVTFGSGDNNTLLAFTSPESGVGQNFIIAAGSGSRTFTNSGGSATQGNAAIFSTAGSITLNNNLILANLVASAPAANTFGFRGVISESGGSFGLTVDTTNVGTVDLRGANTFSGGVSLNGGTTTVNSSSTPNAVGTTAITSGPLGIGAVTLGGDPATAATLGDGGSFSIANPITVAATTNVSARTLMATSANASTTAGSINGPITLNSDLTLSAALVTSSTGNDRLRVGGGGITGSNNIIINNPNIYSGFASKAEIILTGSPTANTPTTWTGNLIIAQGQGALGLAGTAGQGLNATTANNAVLIGSAATFDFSSNSAGIGGFNPTIAGLDDFGTITTPAQVFTTVSTNRTLILAGSGAYAFSGAIEDSVNTSGGTTALTVDLSAPAASQTLSGASTYSGGTTLNGGTLLAANTAGSATGTGNVTLNGGTLGGTGSIAGSIIPGSGPHTLQPGALSIGGDLATNADTTLAFSLDSPTGTNSSLAVAGNVTLNGGTLAITAQTATGAGSLGYYKVLSYAGSLSGDASAIVLPPIVNNIAYTLDTTHDLNALDIHRGYIGDANDDGTVDLNDLNIVLNNLGTAATAWTAGNFDGAATIDLNDLNDVLNHLGTSIASDAGTITQSAISGAPAPEPATLTLAACGAAALLLRRRK